MLIFNLPTFLLIRMKLQMHNLILISLFQKSKNQKKNTWEINLRLSKRKRKIQIRPAINNNRKKLEKMKMKMTQSKFKKNQIKQIKIY